jgi:hypothetical protein
MSDDQPSQQACAPNDASQVRMLSLQIQTMTLILEELRGRVARIERALSLTMSTEDVRAELSKLEW